MVSLFCDTLRKKHARRAGSRPFSVMCHKKAHPLTIREEERGEKREKDAVELRRHGGKGLRGAARHTTREEDER